MRPPTKAEHFRAGPPKRILALDGGGLRGILTLGILRRLEDILRARHRADDAFRLCHYFDLIAGTSTGAIIAAALAIGMSVDEVTHEYFELGSRVFTKDLFRQGVFRAKYDEQRLIGELQRVFGSETRLRDDALKTGLLVMIKRIDSGSPWPVSNNPSGPFFNSGPGGTIGNGDYKLWQAVRASTAAPDYFDPETITIAQMPNRTPIAGQFVDGGVSPFNNPAFQAFMYATISGYGLKWPAGKRNLAVVSVGTGAADPAVRQSRIAAKGALQSLLSLMNDCASFQEALLQWVSDSPTARQIDAELGTLAGDLLGGTELVSYVRYNADLRPVALRTLLGDEARDMPIDTFDAMDAPENMQSLHRVGLAAAEAQVNDAHFPVAFDLLREEAPPGRRRYIPRRDRPVVAVQLMLDTDGLTYNKWGGEQRARRGDWLVDNNGDTYTVAMDVFARTYRRVGPGTYAKVAAVWAERTLRAGAVTTKEGRTVYAAGDYLVSNAADGSDEYAMDAVTFHSTYESAPD